METTDVSDLSSIEKALEILGKGGVVMHPTETCYGLAVDIFDESAVKQVYRLKGRDFAKPLSVLVDGLGMAQEYGIFSQRALELAHKHWPGPLSIVVPRKKSLPDFLNPGEEFVSLRFSSHSFTKALVEQWGGPLTTTSANFSGEAPAYCLDDTGVTAMVDLAIDGGVISQNAPSTVVKVDGDRVEVLRQGGILIEKV